VLPMMFTAILEEKVDLFDVMVSGICNWFEYTILPRYQNVRV